MKMLNFEYCENIQEVTATVEFHNLPYHVNISFEEETSDPRLLFIEREEEPPSCDANAYRLTYKIGEWLEAEYENMLEYIASRFWQLKNDILPIEEEMTREEFICELNLAGVTGHKNSPTIWVNSNSLFHDNYILLTLDAQFNIQDAVIERSV